MSNIQVKIPDQLKKQFKAQCAINGESLETRITILIQEYLKTVKK